MTAGLPGTGIGAIFYLILVLLMPFRELLLLVRGRSSRGRWLTVATQVGFVVGIAFALWLQMRMIDSMTLWAQGAGVISEEVGRVTRFGAHGVTWAAFGSFISLAFAFLVIHAARLIVHLLPSRSSPPALPTQAAPDTLPGKQSLAA